jgi:chemotaxis protein CheX
VVTLVHSGPEPEVIEQIVQDVFVGLLGEVDALPYAMPHDGTPLGVSASVSVTGGWSGHVVFACGEDIGRTIAAGLLMSEPGDINDDDLSDAMGEVANVIGGNVKSVMPGPSKLSLPVAIIGAASDRRPGAVETTRVELAWHDAPMVISVWSAAENPNGEDS